MAEAAPSTLKRLRSSLSPPQDDYPNKTRATTVEPELKSFNDEEAQEWRTSLQAEALEQVKEDAELEAGVSDFVRLEDLDEGIKSVLAGITSKRPNEALVEFRKLLQSDDGGNLLHQYVLLSPKCAEIMSVWSLGPGAEPAVPLLQLLRELMKHPMGRQESSQHRNANRQSLLVVRVRLDRLARSIVSTKLKDIYAHLTSGERSRQCAALLLMSSIVKRGSLLASEVATTFDFTLNALPRLSKASKGSEDKKREIKQSAFKRSTRFAFIEFALSFLEVCHAALLRWVLQIRPLYTGLLHKLASDDETTIISVLRVLQCKVLDSSAMVPPGLQSAIFGDATLEQLAIISSNSLHLEAAQIANDTLLLLCTDPSHGICPEANLSWVASPGKTGAFGGGQGRLVRLMLKLRATENQNHRDLLLSIAAGRPMLVAAYFESFPYSLEPRVSTAWFAAVSLISDIILVTKGPPPFTTLATQGLPPPSIDSSLLQGILRSALPRNLTRLIINRGLLHANMLVKHGCLRMLLEVLSAVEFYLLSISKARRCFQQKHCMGGSAQPTPETMAKTQEAFDASVGRNNPDFDLSVIHDMVESSSGEESVDYQKWLALEKHFQNELRTSSPDPQVLLSMLSLKPVNIGETSQNKKKKGSLGGCTKVLTKDESLLKKKHLLMHDGDNPFRDDLNDDAMDHREDQEAKLVDIWNADSVLIQTGDLEDIGGFLNAKLLEVLAVYQRIIPMALVESSFDIFKILPEEPVSLTSSQQKALLMLLLAASGETPGLDLGYMSQAGCENLHLRHLYRHLKPLVKFMLGSKVGWIREQAQFLAHRAMISSGAFESSNSEIGIWLQFLPLCDDAVVSFLCDAVDTVGRNIDKYVDTLLSIINSAAKQDVFTVPQFGPLLVCVLDKCLRVLASSTRNLKIPQRTSISIYVANALDLLLQSQAHPKALGIVLNVLLCNKKGEILGSVNGFRSEWSPLQNLLLHVQWILRSGDEMSFFDCSACHLPVQSGASAGCFAKALKFCNDDERSSLEAKASALSSCLLCLPVQELAENLPLLMEIFFSVFKGKLPALMGLFSSYKWLLSAIVELWPDLFEKSVALASSLAHSKKANFKRVDLSQQVSKESSLNLSIEENELSNFSASSGITIFAFSVFLLDLPFAIIFPAAANTHEAELLTSDQFSSILEAALSEVPRQLWLSTASLILFWVEELWNLHCKGSDVKYQLENCFSLLKSMIIPSERPGWFSLLQAEEVARVDLNLIADFIRGVLAHPVMNAHLRAAESSVSQVLFGFVEGQIGDHVDSNGMESWFCKGRCALSLLDCHTVDILTELLQWASELPNEDWPAAFVKNCQLVQKVVLISCKPFLTETFYAVKKAVIENQKKNFHGIFPTITTYMAYAFSSYIDIESVLDLSCTLLSKEPSDQKVNCGHSSALSMPYHNVGLYFATSAFDRIGRLIRQKDSQHCNVLKDSLLQNLYEKVLRLVMTRPSERVFACFLSALEAHHSYNLSLDGWLHKSSVAVLSHCIHKTPTQVLTHLMMDVDKTKAKIVLHLVQVSQFYLAEFSEVLSCNLGLASAPVFRLATLVPRPAFGNADYSLKDMILLLPAVNWLINAVKCQEHVPLFKMVEQVTLVYFKVITEITKDWDIFSTDLDMPEVLPFMKSNGPSNEFAKLFGLTTSGQVILMLKHCLVHHPFTIKEREKLFISMMQKSYPLIDSSIRDVGELSLESTLKLVSVMIAKSMMAKMLMLPDILKEDSESVKTDGNSLRGLGGVTGMETEEISANSFEVSNVLIRTLGVLFEQKAFGDKEEKDNDGVLEVSGCQVKVSKHKLLHFLEMALLKDLKDVFQTSADVKPEAQHMAMLKKFTKMVLRFRFGDRLPMQVLRCFASRMAQIPDFARRYAAYGLDLLVGHSHFASTLLSFGATPKHNLLAGCYNQKDTNVRSLASVLSFLRFPLKQHLVDNSTVEAEPKMSYCSRMQCDTHVEGKKLELLKFLRVLYFLKRQASGLEVSAEPTLNSNELLSLLLAAYGATLSEVDKENFLLMQEIESFEGAGFSGLVGMDYLWGEAALKRRQTKVEDDEGYGSFGSADQDTARELHKRCFKEDLMLEPTRCALGVLFFPLRRNILSGAVLLAGGYEEEEVFLSKPCQSLQSITEADERVLKDAAYDPCFILPFALHSLSSGWINADDFVLKGLLALTLVSVASAEEDMRKLGYETLAKFFTILEEGPSFKGKPQIRLLLTFVKNTVLEPWQRLPFVVALFAAEASCVLMNPSDIHYSVVNKFLFRAPGLDLESIPLFKPMFGSGSIHFRADRAWILRLLAFGLRTSFDTRIYRRRFIIEILMSFYTSPLGDRHTREWILQILHRASKLRSLVQYLIEHVGLLSWLASVICSNGTAKSGEYAVGVSNELALEALQIFENALSWRSVKRWLILDGFEELSKLAMLLNCALVQSSSFSERAVFIKPFLRILGTAFSLSHGRKKFQSRLNFSIADFIGIIQLVETENNITTFETRSLALRSILESSPPACCSVQEKTDLCKFGTWALTMVLRDHCVLPYSLEHIGRANPNENAVFSKSRFEVEELMARILGWLAASLILGELQKGVVLQSPATAWAFLRSVTSTNAGTSASESEVNKNLLRLLINLQCLSGTFATNASLVSVVCSCVLLLPTIRGPCGTFLKEFQDVLEEPLSQVSSPCEVNISWRWRPSIVRKVQSASEYETCQMLIALFQKLLHIEENTDFQRHGDVTVCLRAFVNSHRASDLALHETARLQA